jgi:hypothetical protein
MVKILKRGNKMKTETDIIEIKYDCFYDKGNKPFKTKKAAEQFRIENKLDKDFTVSPVIMIINNKYISGYRLRSRLKSLEIVR